MANQFQTELVQRMIVNRITITAAESLTAGMFQSTLADVAGVSAIFPGGFVTYANEAKHQLVGVSKQTIERLGVVSEQTAIEMASGARMKMNTRAAVSFTGVAGPESLEGQPAGTVWIGISFTDHTSFANVYHFSGDRDAVRKQAVAKGFELLARQLN
ncbi:nicotinamide-nucleotide amidohydrolase family protein [Nicoliella spurrieriana]|uniref:Nicotinamide-nucleotide amidohydrolase family protein n=1 Tax=Nicoliella spurrieriana TaxID=2925830 RepID=A0A976RS79_9LACO|nr:nicotinamide-nucleotide amidohydrolase family protein [Nicoliella spurrieriana]UQS86800.1 nicotinamide-nucleotide amidohydrolase family protein [Nicoliella spurrieriana]